MFILPKDYWRIRTTSLKGRGVFAENNIEAGSVIGDYLGKITVPDYKTNDEKEGHYWFWLNEKTSILAYSNKTGVHLINHSCTPNCDVDYYQGHALYFATRKIYKNEELTVDYLLEPPVSGEVCYHSCHCGSPLCRGTFHTNEIQIKKWEKFVKERQNEYYDIQLGEIGSDLRPLEEYPSIIPDNPIHNLWGYEKENPVIIDEKNGRSIESLRKIIRESGKQLYLSDEKIRICGFINKMMIALRVE